MKKEPKKNIKFEISADGKNLGRLASEVARLLIGKHTPLFVRHIASGTVVIVTDAAKLSVSAKKLSAKIYTRYSGYPGGFHEERMKEVAAKKGYAEIIRRAVHGMLPANRLRNERMKNLVIKE